MRKLFCFILLFLLCLIGSSQSQQQDIKALSIGKDNISKIEISECCIVLTLDSNFFIQHDTIYILEYNSIKFNFYRNDIAVIDHDELTHKDFMTTYIIDNQLSKDNAEVIITIWRAPKSDVVSFTRSIEKNFSKKMIFYYFFQNYLQDEDILYVGKKNITKIEMNRSHITLTLDSNFIRLHEDENILRYKAIKFDFFPKSIPVFDSYCSLLPCKMCASIKDNKLQNNLLSIDFWFLPQSNETVVSFKKSIKKNFPKKIISYSE